MTPPRSARTWSAGQRARFVRDMPLVVGDPDGPLRIRAGTPCTVVDSGHVTPSGGRAVLVRPDEPLARPPGLFAVVDDPSALDSPLVAAFVQDVGLSHAALIERAQRCAEGGDADAPEALLGELLDALGVPHGATREQCPDCGSADLARCGATEERTHEDLTDHVECGECGWSWTSPEPGDA